ncbi:hypothetical protein JKF63_00975 [Porcisia hertigi]|uniref:ATPase n=1 Tax=Porcisia hertigi TaxID=2761500 RepID=A0A836L7H8_9TRYP|nr:hypothetical protein JKF63_00975 [Porcisia hertigi]
MLRGSGCQLNIWASHLSTKRTVVEAYEQLTRKGVITADARQLYMSDACTPLLRCIHQSHADETAGKVTPYSRQSLSGGGEGGRSTRSWRSLRASMQATLAGYARWPFLDPLTRTLGLLEAENLGVEEKRGLYLWGDVGIGKTMILDLFDLCTTPYKKRRSHLHSFMTELQNRLFLAEIALTQRRQSAISPEEKSGLHAVCPMNVVVQEVLNETPILCFDEFQTFDVAHAALLASFFTEALRKGLFLITTSNRPPEDLCHVSASFSAFLPVLRQHCRVVHCTGIRDYRVKSAAERHHQLLYLHPNTRANVERLLRRVEYAFRARGVDPAWVKEDILWHHGRSVAVPVRCRGCAMFDFSDICGAREGFSSADIQLITRHFHTLIVTNVPQMSNLSVNASHQFVVLVDEIYQNNVKLLFTSSVPWDHLMDPDFAAGDVQALTGGESGGLGGCTKGPACGGLDAEAYSEGEDERSGYTAHYNFRNEEELISFARIRSRLHEMCADSYLLRDHRQFIVTDFDFSALFNPEVQQKVCE